jgi:hypothetical protein
MRHALAPTCVLLFLGAASCGGGDGTGGDGGSGCSDDACKAACEETHATELEESPFSGIEASCQGSGMCSCAFFPCYEASCRSYCADKYGIDAGVCDLLSCQCLSGDGGS